MRSRRWLVTSALLLALTMCAVAAQTPGVLHIKVMLTDAEGRPMPVPRHAVLVSENPPTAPPRRIVTSSDGTAELKLRPGSYVVESDRPVAFNGKGYQWTQFVEISAGREASLELSAANAEVVTIVAGEKTSGGPAENDPSFLLPRWQARIVAVWTTTARLSGVLVDRGLVVTSARAVGTETSAEVQPARDLKVAGRVLASDPARDVAILRIDPGTTPGDVPVPLDCARGDRPTLAEGQDVFAIGAPLHGPKELTPATVNHVSPDAVVIDVRLTNGSIGGPVFSADGTMVGITSPAEGEDEHRRREARLVRTEAICAVLASARPQMDATSPPSATHLPVEPSHPFPLAALKEAAARRSGGLMAYKVAASDFDVAFITPVLVYAAQQQGREASGGGQMVDAGGLEAQLERRVLTDFANWSEYVAEGTPVLLVRATPRLAEGFWTKAGRVAARTQGVALPPFKHFSAGFARMRVFCGDAEITPIHPFRLEQPISERDTIREGLYVFDPGAIGPHCAAVKVVLFSDKAPDKGDTRLVDPKIVQQVWDDFAPYRAAGSNYDRDVLPGRPGDGAFGERAYRGPGVRFRVTPTPVFPCRSGRT